ncbi:MAG: AAA family ATPase [Anaerolineae bacterium]|jgi:cytidylate kinase
MVSVTVSREYGSGGDQIARRIAEALGVPVLDRELIEAACQVVEPEVAAACQARVGGQVPPAEVKILPEEAPSFAERLVRTITGGTRQWPRVPTVAVPVGETDSVLRSLVPTDEAYVDVMRGVFERILAQQGNAVFVGRGGQVLLADRVNVLHVHISAPYAARVRRVMKEENLSEAEAIERVVSKDDERRDYLSRYHGVSWTEPSLYHLTLNTGRLTEDQATELILRTAQMIQVGEMA